MELEGIDIQKGKQSTIFLKASGLTVAIDPWEASGEADLILITHEHYDHCDPESIATIRKEDSVVIGPDSCASKVDGLKVVKPGESLEVKGVKVEAVDAYNANHQKGQCLGFVVTLAGKRVYHAGDTDRIPEMKSLGTIDIAILPVGGTYTMNAEEAAAAANEDIKPKVAIPIHYGDVVGSKQDAERFREICQAEVRII